MRVEQGACQARDRVLVERRRRQLPENAMDSCSPDHGDAPGTLRPGSRVRAVVSGPGESAPGAGRRPARPKTPRSRDRRPRNRRQPPVVRHPGLPRPKTRIPWCRAMGPRGDRYGPRPGPVCSEAGTGMLRGRDRHGSRRGRSWFEAGYRMLRAGGDGPAPGDPYAGSAFRRSRSPFSRSAPSWTGSRASTRPRTAGRTRRARRPGDRQGEAIPSVHGGKQTHRNEPDLARVRVRGHPAGVFHQPADTGRRDGGCGEKGPGSLVPRSRDQPFKCDALSCTCCALAPAGWSDRRLDVFSEGCATIATAGIVPMV